MSCGPGISKYNPTITFHGRMCHEIEALQPLSRMLPQFAKVYTHNTEHATSKRKHFYTGLLGSLLSQLALMLEENNNLVKPFISLRNVIQSNRVPNNVKLVIDAHEKQCQDMFESTMYLKQVKLQP